ncbi:MAG: hypothetical protein N2111_06015 [Candidatus Sumerlaeaceae bacterium]|nr:hypothetical protein [Candidatus Sumerlaeaceae bacterium]
MANRIKRFANANWLLIEQTLLDADDVLMLGNRANRRSLKPPEIPKQDFQVRNSKKLAFAFYNLGQKKASGNISTAPLSLKKGRLPSHGTPFV